MCTPLTAMLERGGEEEGASRDAAGQQAPGLAQGYGSQATSGSNPGVNPFAYTGTLNGSTPRHALELVRVAVQILFAFTLVLPRLGVVGCGEKRVGGEHS